MIPMSEKKTSEKAPSAKKEAKKPTPPEIRGVLWATVMRASANTTKVKRESLVRLIRRERWDGKCGPGIATRLASYVLEGVSGWSAVCQLIVIR